jgi:hypothetical protein
LREGGRDAMCGGGISTTRWRRRLTAGWPAVSARRPGLAPHGAVVCYASNVYGDLPEPFRDPLLRLVILPSLR